METHLNDRWIVVLLSDLVSACSTQSQSQLKMWFAFAVRMPVNQLGHGLPRTRVKSLARDSKQGGMNVHVLQCIIGQTSHFCSPCGMKAYPEKQDLTPSLIREKKGYMPTMSGKNSLFLRAPCTLCRSSPDFHKA